MSVQAIGQPVRREEDLRLLKGRGRYVDDIREPNEARGYVLRSPHAHARIGKIETRRALAAPGVLAVLTGEDLRRRGLGTLMPQVRRRRRNGAPAFVCPQPLLARDRVRYVGDPVAFIVAETLDQAKDAAELIDIGYEPLPAAISAEAALAADAPAVWDENPGNEAFFHEIGDKAAVDDRLCQSRPHCPPHDPDQPGHGKQHGAARVPRALRPGSRPLYDPLHDPVGARHQGGIGRSHIQTAAAPVPGGLRQYGRRLWHEGRLLPGIWPLALGIRGNRTSGPLDCRAQRRVVERRTGARQRRRDCAGARQGRAVSGAARAVEGGDRRLFFDRSSDDTADHRARLSGQYLRHPGGSRASHRGADQYDEHRPLPRRQPARADLCDRDDHRQSRP